MDGLNYNVQPVRAASDAAPERSTALDGTAFDASGSVIERIYLGAVGSKTRILAVASCAAAGRRPDLARALAARCALAGERTLLLDLTRPVSATPASAPWVPGNGRAATSVARHPTGYDTLEAAGCSVSAMRLRNIDGLRRLLGEELAVYRMIIVDAGDVTASAAAVVPTATAVQVCDSVVLLTAPGRIGRHEFEQATEAMGPARSRIVGLVIDDTESPSVGEEMCRVVGRAKARLPRVARWLERKLVGAGLLWATL